MTKSHRTRLSVGVIALAGLAAESSRATPATRPSTPDYAACTRSARVPFAGRVDFGDLRSMHVRVSVNGGPPTRFQVDTGSVGIIVAADEVPDVDPHAPPGSIVYSSSGVELDGVWTTATVAFVDAAKGPDGRVPTALVPVLATTEMKVHGGAVNGGAKATTRPRPHMFGVGFGRGAEPHPERNPFLNLDAMRAGTMRRGYTITRDGYTLGLAGTAVGDGYRYQPLTERPVPADVAALRPGLKDWATARGRVTVGDEMQPDVAVLIDTGLTNMMVGKPGQTEAADVPAGMPVTVDLLGGQLQYRFTVGDAKGPTTPRRVTWVKPSAAGPSVNTGLRALAAFDYLYDADGGYLGLRPVPRRPATRPR